MAKSKKIILFIVEGPTEKIALGSIFYRIFNPAYVEFDVVHGDLTSNYDTWRNPREAVREIVLDYIKANRGFRWDDIKQVVQICDTDGAFIPESSIIQSDNEKTVYTDDCIFSTNPNGIIDRNSRKKYSMNKLVAVKSLTYRKKSIPYAVYFLSRNMEHAFYNIKGNLSDEKKSDLAYKFRKKYINNIDEFLAFLKSSDIAVEGSYKDTWDYIKVGNNSLKRGSNLYLVLPD